MKKTCFLLLAFLILAVGPGCKTEKTLTTQSEQPSPIITPTANTIVQDSSETGAKISPIPGKTASSIGDTGDDTPLKWPTELMGDILPVPNGAITSIDKANQIWGKDAPDYIIVVSLKNMSKDDCIMYVNKLEKLGFAGGVSEQSDKKISFSGGIDDVGIGVSFSYDFIENKGFVAYNPKL